MKKIARYEETTELIKKLKYEKSDNINKKSTRQPRQ